MKDDVNPLDPEGQGWRLALAAADAAPRCRAHSKRTGEPCRAPAVTGWRVCRVHGAGGGHRAGPTHPSWKHGMRSREWVEMRRTVNELVRETREVAALIG
jgi:hypothetical protein